MAEGRRRVAGPWRRTELIGAAVVLIAAALVLCVALVSGGLDSAPRRANEDVLGAPPPTPSSADAAVTKSGDRGNRSRLKRSANRSRPERSVKPAAAPSKAEGCDPSWTEMQCRAALAYRHAGRDSHIVKDGTCPFASKARCRELYRLYKQRGGSHVVEDGECPVSDQATCEQLGRLYRSNGGSSPSQ